MKSVEEKSHYFLCNGWWLGTGYELYHQKNRWKAVQCQKSNFNDSMEGGTFSRNIMQIDPTSQFDIEILD